MIPDTLSVAEAAAHFSKSASTIRYWCRTGRLPATRIGRAWRIDASVLQQSSTAIAESSPPAATASTVIAETIAVFERQIAAKDAQIAELSQLVGMFRERVTNLDSQVKLLTAGPEFEEEQEEQPKSWWRRILRR